MEIEKELNEILKILNTHGKGYIVGGYVRDKLMGVKPKDCDFCTDIDYEKLLYIFKKYNPKEIGKAFGIVQINYKGKAYEIAKLRRDSDFTKERNKLQIEFVNDIYEDLKRRDFTVNAIAFNGEKLIYESELSKEDIKNKVIRFVGEGRERIKEDPLRLLRGIRIATEKSMEIDKETERSMFLERDRLKNISMERVQEEIFKIFKSENIYFGMKKLVELKTLQGIFPKLQRDIEKNKNLEKISNISGSIKLSLIFLFSKENLEELKKLKIEKRLKIEIENSIKTYDEVEKLDTKYSVRKFLNIYGANVLKNILEVKRLRKIESIFNKIFENSDPIELKDLKVKGKDLMDIGISSGPKIKEILLFLMEIVLKEPNINKKELLIEKAKEML